MPIGTNAPIIVHSNQAAVMHLSPCELRIIQRVREAARKGRVWMLVLHGDPGGVSIRETLPPERAPHEARIGM